MFSHLPVAAEQRYFFDERGRPHNPRLFKLNRSVWLCHLWHWDLPNWRVSGRWAERIGSGRFL